MVTESRSQKSRDWQKNEMLEPKILKKPQNHGKEPFETKKRPFEEKKKKRFVAPLEFQ